LQKKGPSYSPRQAIARTNQQMEQRPCYYPIGGSPASPASLVRFREIQQHNRDQFVPGLEDHTPAYSRDGTTLFTNKLQPGWQIQNQPSRSHPVLNPINRPIPNRLIPFIFSRAILSGNSGRSRAQRGNCFRPRRALMKARGLTLELCWRVRTKRLWMTARVKRRAVSSSPGDFQRRQG